MGLKRLNEINNGVRIIKNVFKYLECSSFQKLVSSNFIWKKIIFHYSYYEERFVAFCRSRNHDMLMKICLFLLWREWSTSFKYCSTWNSRSHLPLCFLKPWFLKIKILGKAYLFCIHVLLSDVSGRDCFGRDLCMVLMYTSFPTILSMNFNTW